MHNRLSLGVVGTVGRSRPILRALATSMMRPPSEAAMLTVDSPLTLSEAEKVPVELVPGHGEHCRAILPEAGYSEAKFADLHAAGTIGVE
jgi:crotonobetainyl-CoA:carnitine CoA-transferase CaiB-like acyl-CoA transferase